MTYYYNSNYNYTQFVDYGTVCRESTEVCGITEYCTGEDSDVSCTCYIHLAT